MTYFINRFSTPYICVLTLLLGICCFDSCRKPQTESGTLEFHFAKDDNPFDYPSLTFDTVFTSVGSITKKFRVINRSNDDVITNIFLAGGKQSQYTINVNGMSSANSYFEKVTIPKKDSIFVFVKVNINPKNQNDPFFVTDSIVFVNGKYKQDVKLLACGQDAHYIIANQGPEGFRYKVVAGLPADYPGLGQQVTWTNERPYVVYGWAVVDSLCKLTIEPGTKIYFHNNSGLLAYRYSELEVNGTTDAPVLFRGDRLEKWFDRDYNQWNRIWINEGVNATINNAIITNAFIGVQVDPFPDDRGITITTNSSVTIENTIIKNTKSSGVLSRFLNLDMTNCLITNNGGCGLQLECGQYTMKHLTVATYSTSRKTPVCYVSNKVSDPAYELIPAQNSKAEFINCIMYGNEDTEVEVHRDKGAELDAQFHNCLVKFKNAFSANFINCLRNEDPKFTDTSIDKLDFRLRPDSPAIGKGKPNIGVDKDILGNPRGNNPDLGAYQFVR